MKLILHKMYTKLEENKVLYSLFSDDNQIVVNDYLNKYISIEKTGVLQCIDCKKQVKKFYGQGLCYVCTQASPLNSPCIINPELCEAHLGKGRDVAWEETHHLRPHIVYLANSGGLKVGVTRDDQMPTRWIDQGADAAIVLAYVPYRQLAGQIEVVLKKYMSDKTNWRLMLKNEIDKTVNLLAEKNKYKEVLDNINNEFSQYIATDDTVYDLGYPTTILTESVKSINLSKVEGIAGTLTGIKGQYLIFNHRDVINIRSHTGFEVELKIAES